MTDSKFRFSPLLWACSVTVVFLQYASHSFRSEGFFCLRDLLEVLRNPETVCFHDRPFFYSFLQRNLPATQAGLPYLFQRACSGLRFFSGILHWIHGLEVFQVLYFRPLPCFLKYLEAFLALSLFQISLSSPLLRPHFSQNS